MSDEQIAQLRSATGEGVDYALLREVCSRLLHEGCSRQELVSELDSLGQERRAMNDEIGQDVIGTVIESVLPWARPVDRLPDHLPLERKSPPLEIVEQLPLVSPPLPSNDRRPRLPEPPPVRLITVEDATLPAPAGLEVELDAFYVELLEFERDDAAHDIIYKAENFCLRFALWERPPAREGMRSLGIEVMSLAELEAKLIDREIEYARHRGLLPGMDKLALMDPAGNWLEITEQRLLL